MIGGDMRRVPSLSLFAALQFVWILLATLGLWGNLRDLLPQKVDEQVWMFGLTLPLTLVSIYLSRLFEWNKAPALIGISAGLHFVIYFLPLFFLMGAHVNIIALREYASLLGFFALLYTCAIVAGVFLFRLFKKEPAT
jgi:hypothetical protein